MKKLSWILFLAAVFVLSACENSETDAAPGEDTSSAVGANSDTASSDTEGATTSDAVEDTLSVDANEADASEPEPTDTNVAVEDAMVAEDVPEVADAVEMSDITAAPDSMADAEPMPQDVAVPQEDTAVEETPKPDLPMGPADKLAQAGCDLIEGPMTPLTAVADMADAGQVLLTPTPNSAFAVTLPGSGVGYLTLEVPEWAIIIGGGVNYANTLEVLDPDWVTEVILPLSWNGACSAQGLTDQRLKYHAWGSFTVKLTGTPDDVIHLSFIKEE